MTTVVTRKKLVFVPSFISFIVCMVLMFLVVGALTIDSTVNNAALFVPLFVAWVATMLGVAFSAIWFVISDIVIKG